MPDQPFERSDTVYLEDTDAMGLVYHASYLRFMERGRTDTIGAERLRRLVSDGLLVVVYEMKIKFRAPARFGDRLTVRTRPKQRSPFRLLFHQKVLRGEELLVSAEAHCTCTREEEGVTEIPDELLEALGLKPA